MTDTGTAITDTPPTATPPTAAPPPETPPTGDTAGLYNIGETLDGRVVVSRTAETVWDAPETMCWLEGETEAQARPWSTIQAENDGKLIIAAEPTPLPRPGEIAEQVIKDLGWDPETTAAMAQARMKADPERYPTPESATYTDPVAAAPAPAAPAAPVAPAVPPVQ